MIEIVSYGGNIGSISRAFERLGACYRLVGHGDALGGSNPIVLPGVGAFGSVMQRLEELELKLPLARAIENGAPFLGICIGMQILFDESEESPGVAGMGIVPGRVVKFRTAKIPQIGWNRVVPQPARGYEPGHAYFVNSYHAVPADDDVVLYTADYGGIFCAAINRGNVTAFQFHPEKSLRFGEALLTRWLNAV